MATKTHFVVHISVKKVEVTSDDRTGLRAHEPSNPPTRKVSTVHNATFAVDTLNKLDKKFADAALLIEDQGDINV